MGKTLTMMLAAALAAPAALADGPRVVEHIEVYREAGRFGGWPANHGIWNWGDEILVGFGRGYYKDLGNRHHIDREKPEEHWFARSLDGGETWTLEDPSETIVPWGAALHGVRPPHLIPKTPVQPKEPIRFTHPDFAITFRMLDHHVGPSMFYYSYDRGRTWNGPFDLVVNGAGGIGARTDYIVEGKRECTVFFTAAKSDGREGRPLCARTTDGGLTWNVVSWIGPEPEGFSIMPASVRLSENELIVATRRREGPKRWIETYLSQDNGFSWESLNTPVDDLGAGNPPSLIRLRDGRLCLTYGVRAEPFGIRAQLSDDGGRTWSEPIHLRDDGSGGDLGYVRSVQREDGKVVSVYYFQDHAAPERYIAATIWDPGD